MKKVLIVLFSLFAFIIMVVIISAVIALYMDYRDNKIIEEHLAEINTCIKRHVNTEADDVIKYDCTKGFLFIYKNTRKKTDYNILAEKIKYEYPNYINMDNRTLIKNMLNVYPSIKENITGLD